MRRLLAGLVGIAVVAGVLVWFAQGVAVGQDPGEPAQQSWGVKTLEKPQDAYTFGQAGIAELLPSNKYEDFEDPQNWPNDWLLLANHDKVWGPNQCLAYDGDYDGWVEVVGPDGHQSHHDYPGCTSPTGYNDDFVSWLDYGPFSLEGKTQGGVSLKLWNDTEFQHDYFGVYASIDCENYSGSWLTGDTGGWIDYDPQYLNFADWPNLGNILGQPTVCVGFIFQSDASHTGSADMGCFLDNINIWSSTGGSPTPVPTYTPTPTETPVPTYTPTATITPTPVCPRCGDVNCDLAVDAVDALFILQYVVGLRDELCVPCCPGP